MHVVGDPCNVSGKNMLVIRDGRCHKFPLYTYMNALWASSSIVDQRVGTDLHISKINANAWSLDTGDVMWRKIA